MNLSPDRRTQDRLQIGGIVKSLLLWNENQIITNQLVRQIGSVTQEADQNNQRRWTDSDENRLIKGMTPSARIPSNFLLRRGMIWVLNAVTTVYDGFEYAENAHKKYTKTCTYGRFFGNALICNFQKF